MVTGVVKLNREPIYLRHAKPAIVRDDRGAVVLQAFREVLEPAELRTLLRTTMDLMFSKAKFKEDIKRGVNRVYHLGCWRSYKQQPFVTSGSRSQGAQDWIIANRTIFLKLNDLFLEYFPSMFQRYMDADIPVRMFGSWAAVAINCSLSEKIGIRAPQRCT